MPVYGLHYSEQVKMTYSSVYLLPKFDAYVKENFKFNNKNKNFADGKSSGRGD